MSQSGFIYFLISSQKRSFLIYVSSQFLSRLLQVRNRKKKKMTNSRYFASEVLFSATSTIDRDRKWFFKISLRRDSNSLFKEIDLLSVFIKSSKQIFFNAQLWFSFINRQRNKIINQAKLKKNIRDTTGKTAASWKQSRTGCTPEINRKKKFLN